MSVRREPPIGRLVPVAELSQYDLLLATLPVPLIVGVLLSTLTGVPVAYGAGVGALLSGLLLGYALFVAAPAPVADRAGAVDRVGETGETGPVADD